MNIDISPDGNSRPEAEYSKAKLQVLKHLSSRENKHLKDFELGGEYFSASELIEEVLGDTEIGRAFVGSFKESQELKEEQVDSRGVKTLFSSMLRALEKFRVSRKSLAEYLKYAKEHGISEVGLTARLLSYLDDGLFEDVRIQFGFRWKTRFGDDCLLKLDEQPMPPLVDSPLLELAGPNGFRLYTSLKEAQLAYQAKHPDSEVDYKLIKLSRVDGDFVFDDETEEKFLWALAEHYLELKDFAQSYPRLASLLRTFPKAAAS